MTIEELKEKLERTTPKALWESGVCSPTHLTEVLHGRRSFTDQMQRRCKLYFDKLALEKQCEEYRNRLFI